MSRKNSRNPRGRSVSAKPRRAAGTAVARPRRRWWRGLLLTCLALLLALVGYSLYLDHQIVQRFAGSRWELPARVYARPLELYPGATLTVDDLRAELKRLGYRRSTALDSPGTFSGSGKELDFVTRDFRFWDGAQPSLAVSARFRDGSLVDLKNRRSGDGLYLVRLDPELIGSLFPHSGEDRILVRLNATPQLLRQMLLQVEDRRFYQHFGLDLRAIGRAFMADVRSGGIVQGGSTLTQQLVRSYFLDNRQTLWRKFTEAIMAVELEWHYGKDEIFEAYLNEVYMGQDGPRAIHGFGLASHFYFKKPLKELDPAQLALLVALVKGPSYYDPRRYPDRARERRNLVLDVAAKQQLLTPAEAAKAEAQPLGVVKTPPEGTSYYPAFMDVVRNQLTRDYRPEDLTSAGLQIFTTLDPRLQTQLEETVSDGVGRLEQDRGMPDDTLEAAAAVTSVEGDELLAVVGGRRAGYAGFNRAVNAVRPIGSLAKPAVYLTALGPDRHYTWATQIEDSPLDVQLPNGKSWHVDNYNDEYHGKIPLYQALVHSYNVPTVKVGLDVGVDSVAQTLRALGFRRKLNPYPSLLLGASAMSPLEVAQLYNTLATGGFHTPLTAIRDVLDVDGVPLKRYPLKVDAAVDPRSAYLVDRAMQEVVRQGTGRSARTWVPADWDVAGKTGTTDDFRDSWFAGFSGNHVAVVWVGRDDNKPTGLTGASGALQIWARFMGRIPNQTFAPLKPAGVNEVWLNPKTGKAVDDDCAGAVMLPFLKGTAPEQGDCDSSLSDWLHKVFD